MSDSKAPTHTAFALKREGRRFHRWLEIGKARMEGPGKPADVMLDRTPIGGWNGYVYLAPIGTKPPDPDPEPHHPAQGGREEDV